MSTIIQSKISLKSTYIYSVSPGTNFYTPAATQNLVRSTAGPSLARTMFRVRLADDMGGIPYSSIISVKLHWYAAIVSGTGFLSVQVFDESPPSSGTIDLSWTTWLWRALSTPWGMAGGDIGPLLIPAFPMDSVGWYNIDITAWAIDSIGSGEKFLYLTVPTYQNRVGWIVNERDTLNPTLQPYLEIEYEPMVCQNNLSDLGRFRLGCTILGAALGQIPCNDSLTISEGTVPAMIQPKPADAISISEEASVADSIAESEAAITIAEDSARALEGVNSYETISVTDSNPELAISAAILDAITIAEMAAISNSLALSEAAISIVEDFSVPYATDGWAGIMGRITLRMDVTSVDFCAMVEESGMSVEINDVPARVYCFLKQRGQQFEPNIQILPGDAVIFSCPTDPVSGPIKAGDIVKFDFREFEVLAVRNKYFDGNIIYRKSLLRKLRVSPNLPQVGNLAASANLDGKTKLTWDAIDKSIWGYLDGYEVHESTDGIAYFLREKTASNSLSIANLVPNTKYYYKVRAIDKYNKLGDFSAVVETPIDITPPAAPVGGR